MTTVRKSLVKIISKAGESLSYLWKTFRLVYSAAPKWTSAWAALLVLQGVLPVASVYLTKLLVDSLVVAIREKGNWAYIRPALFLVTLAALVMLLTEFLKGATEWVRTAQAELIQDHVKGLIHRKSMVVDLAFYESPEYHDKLEQSRNEASSRPLALLESSGALGQNAITLVAMSAVLMRHSLWLPIILFLSTSPAFYMILHFDRYFHRWWERTTADRRWAQYYDVMLTHPMAAAELRLFDLGGYFQEGYQRLRRRLRTERLRQMRKQSTSKLVAGVIAMVFSGATMAWMVWRVLHGLATLGDLALFYQAFNLGQGLMRSLLGSLSKILSSSLYLGNLFTFLELKPTIIDQPSPLKAPSVLTQGIDFRNITFRYPGSLRPALQEFSVFIPAGKVVAIVGPNGAGKSTLLKLLCRFYDSEVGSVNFDDTDIRSLSVKDLRRMITVLFQFPINYHETVGRSISMGDILVPPESEGIQAAARNAGADEFIARLPKGYDTLLGKVLADGVELSGGEWQRLAMARAFFRQAPIILLDEPTSSMDSWAEAEWFKRFDGLARGRTAILVTHRFTIAMRADIIHVMNDGKIVESGSHHELLGRNGLYAQSWAKQIQGSSNEMDEDQPTEPRMDEVFSV